MKLFPRGANVCLRIVVMGSKLILMSVLAKIMAPEDVGLYGIVAATLSFSVLLIGGDFYLHSQRELLSKPRTEWSFVLQHQIIGTTIIYLVTLPIQSFIFYFDLIPKHVAMSFLVLLVLEHLAQEMNRVLIAIQRPVLATIVLFLRYGAWVYFLLPIMWVYREARSIDVVLMAWMLGCASAILCGGIVVWRAVRPWTCWKLDTSWLKRGFSVGSIFLLATISLKALLTLDRYVVKCYAGADLLGVYVVYVSVAMVILNVIDPAVFSFVYPPLVSAYRRGDHSSYHRLMRELTRSTVWLSLAIAIGLAVTVPYALEWTGRRIYTEHLSVLWLLLGMAIIHVIGMVPHYGLYALGADTTIVIANTSSLPVFVAVLLLLARKAPFAGVPYALIAAFAWIGGVKFLWYQIAMRKTVLST